MSTKKDNFPEINPEFQSYFCNIGDINIEIWDDGSIDFFCDDWNTAQVRFSSVQWRKINRTVSAFSKARAKFVAKVD
jgi:hypothetical protein